MIYFTSDLHLWHSNIIRFCDRPYVSAEEMNAALIKNWNDTVGPEDTVYCLGDFSLAARPVEAITSLLNGKKFLVPGNHDFVHSYNRKSHTPAGKQKWIDKYTEWGWTLLSEQTTLELPGIATVNLCHFPYSHAAADIVYDDKFLKWRPIDDGRWLLCGHVHEKWKHIGRMINVGVDQWNFRPVSATEIGTIICSQQQI